MAGDAMTALLMFNLLIIGFIVGYWAHKLWLRLYIRRRVQERLWRVAQRATKEDGQ